MSHIERLNVSHNKLACRRKCLESVSPASLTADRSVFTPACSTETPSKTTHHVSAAGFLH